MLAFPTSKRHEPAGPFILKFQGEALRSGNVVCNITHGAVEEILEYNLKREMI